MFKSFSTNFIKLFMSQYRIYTISTTVFVSFFVLASFIIISLLVRNNTLSLLDNVINDAVTINEHTTKLATFSLEKNIKKEEIVSVLQQMSNQGKSNFYYTIVDWSGTFIVHPDITKVGNKAISNDDANFIKTSITSEALYTKIKKDAYSMDYVIYLSPIPNIDWVQISHVKTSEIKKNISDLTYRYFVTFLLLGLTLLLLILGLVRLFHNHFLKQLREKSDLIESGVLNLSKLNFAVESYQKNISNEDQEIKTKEDAALKLRLITYVRNELVPVLIKEISHIYTENTITYIIDINGKKATSNESLDQIYNHLDPKVFFRANRQVIIAIWGIKKIVKYSNNKLKIETNPQTEIEILIGKNKTASFKNWLDL